MTICKEPSCKTRASYNVETEKKPIYCLKHKSPEMIDINSKKCKEKGCNTRPSYNKEGEKPIYCLEHKKEEMVNVVSHRCQKEGCNVGACFNKTGKKIGMYCSEHKEEGMIDIRSKRCIEEDCYKNPTYNLKGTNTRLYCKDHKKTGMIDIAHKKCIRCQEKRPSFNLPEKKPGLYCKSCLTPEELNTFIHISARKCKSCCMYFCFENKTITLCSYCNPNKYQKTKENEIKKILQENSIEFIHDKYVREQETCLCYRPDFVIQNEKNIVILEVDEYEHKGYEISCEVSRMYNIIAHFTERYSKPVKFIRYNPDSKEKNKEEKLIETLKENSEQVEDMSVVYLFYSKKREMELRQIV